MEIIDGNGCLKIRYIILINVDGDVDFFIFIVFFGDCGVEGKIKVEVLVDVEKFY